MITIIYNGSFYNADCYSEIWLTRLSDNSCKLCLLKHPGYQYREQIERVFNQRGFTFSFR